MVRLQKHLADCGVASRRASEALILAGRVQVNGEIVQQLGTKVDPARDEVAVDGRQTRSTRKLYVALNKPPGYTCSRRKIGRQPLVAELLPAEWAAIYPVGRLDRESEGLLFLTNDGEFCLRLTHPRFGVRKTYLATVIGRVDSTVLAALTRGVICEGERLRAERVRLVSANASHSVVELELAEGKHREVRRLFESQGFVVSRLQRIRIGPIKLGELRPGRWRVLTPAEVGALESCATGLSAPMANIDRT